MDLVKERESLIRQRDKAFAVYQQAIGAITLLDALIAEEASVKDSMTVDEFKNAIGAQSAEIVKH